MISNFWDAVYKWQKLWEMVCNGDMGGGTSWVGWQWPYVMNQCGYCEEFDRSEKCIECPLYECKGTNSIYDKLKDACSENNYDSILYYTHKMLQAVSKPEYKKYFKGGK